MSSAHAHARAASPPSTRYMRPGADTDAVFLSSRTNGWNRNEPEDLRETRATEDVGLWRNPKWIKRQGDS